MEDLSAEKSVIRIAIKDRHEEIEFYYFKDKKEASLFVNEKVAMSKGWLFHADKMMKIEDKDDVSLEDVSEEIIDMAKRIGLN